MVETMMQILTWAIPSGGIGAAIAWIANRRVKTAEASKKVHDVYKQMYEELGKELLSKQEELNENAKKNARAIDELNKENTRTRYAVNRLTRAIETIQLCPHRATCPVSDELQNSEEYPEGGESGKARVGKRQHRKPKADGGEPDCGDTEG